MEAAQYRGNAAAMVCAVLAPIHSGGMMFAINLRWLAAMGGMSALTCGTLYAAPLPVHETSYAYRGGVVIIPASSQYRSEDAGVRAHTHTRIFLPNGIRAQASSPPVGYETPASLACVYGFVKAVTGCNPTTVTTLPTGGSNLVLIVDAYDDPTAANDLSVYSKEYGLPAITNSNFEVVYASGSKPGQDNTGGWELEESLDIEMAHAMAPGAKVILVEAASDSNADLLKGVSVAASMAASAGGGEVSSSWGEGEFSGETSYESTFSGSNAVFFASTGDSPGPEFPSVLQNVVGAGGTSINRNGSHNFVSQTSWSDGGGGISKYVSIPSYQAAEKKVAKIVGKFRGVPDFSFDANPNTGVEVYDSTAYEGTVYDWLVVGGTSVASPALAASINSAGSFASSTVAELTTVYGDYTVKTDWTDITSGGCDNKGGIDAKKGYDLCTGVGVPNGYAGK
jgi:subtilase family serine protease